MNDLPRRIELALGGLDSPNVETRVRAVEEPATCSSSIATRVAAVFAEHEESRFLVFERLGRFGSLVVEPMRQVYEAAQSGDLKMKSASALLYLGDRTGVPSLIAAVREKDENLCAAATVLSDCGITDAVGPIEDAILECDLSDGRILSCLMGALRKLEVPISEAVRELISEVEPLWLRDSLLR